MDNPLTQTNLIYILLLDSKCKIQVQFMNFDSKINITKSGCLKNTSIIDKKGQKVAFSLAVQSYATMEDLELVHGFTLFMIEGLFLI